jgi:hypothetical protein
LKYIRVQPGTSSAGLFDSGNPMPNDNPVFSVRSLGDGAGYVIDVVWSDGATDRLGLFASPDDAARWVDDSPSGDRDPDHTTDERLFMSQRPPCMRGWSPKTGERRMNNELCILSDADLGKVSGGDPNLGGYV